ncbi:endo alpha-1,4 polygalactosaminidase precursor, partial [Microthyrium microscopicum]
TYQTMKTFIITALLCHLALSTPLTSSNILPRDIPAAKPVWQPPLGARFQIVLSRGLARTRRDVQAGNATILDLDLFDTPKAQIQQLQAQGKRVICYFSAGSSESWRSDYKQIKPTDMGEALRDWPAEKWLDIRSPDIFTLMQSRIKIAAEKGCDAIDPDNVDAFGDESRKGGGFATPLKQSDSVAFIRKLSAEAHQHGIAIGLKNADAILNQVSDVVEFAVNEQCATDSSGCSMYEKFVNRGKPVFHIEYAKYTSPDGKNVSISSEEGNSGRQKVSTVIKQMNLDNFVLWCDG